ncbi:RING finger protein 17 isoform X3 [Lepisosteus oculatus]|uniref:RING finger protein 17 isoform X3 n=1 Tax=Lepisosteus oculatus TaxID=7918 RepID=UPI0035F5013D
MLEGSGERSAPVCEGCSRQYTLSEDEVVGNLPLVLVCGHVFCSSCLWSLASNGEVIVCPQCKAETQLSVDGVEGLPGDKRIMGLIYTTDMKRQKSQAKTSVSEELPALEMCCQSVLLSDVNKEKTVLNSDPLQAVDDALLLASEKMSQLQSLHEVLLNGFENQVENEKARLLKEIDEAVHMATTALNRRRGILVGELANINQYFPATKCAIEKVEEEQRILELAVQNAKQVQQVPALGSYCDVEKVVATLQSCLSREDYLSCLGQASGLSCSLDYDGFIQNLNDGFKIRCDAPKTVAPEDSRQLSIQKQMKLSVTRHGNQEPPSQLKDCGMEVPEPPSHESFGSSDVMTYKNTEIPESGTGVRFPSEKSAMPKKTKKALAACPPLTSRRVFQEWVFVTHVVNPSHFYVRRVAETKAAASLAKKIRLFCDDEKTFLDPEDVLEVGTLIFVKLQEEKWSRATITELVQRCSDCQSVPRCAVAHVSKLQVYFTDFGNTEEISLARSEDYPVGDDCSIQVANLNECIRKPDLAVQSEMRRWTSLAVKCSLMSIVPHDWQEGWRREARGEFVRVVGSKAVEMKVFGEDGDTLLVDLQKSRMDRLVSDMPISLREYLVFMELARFYSPGPWNEKTLICEKKSVRYCLPVYPKLNEEFSAVVCHIVTPSDFYIQLVDNSESLILMSKLQDFYSQGGSGLEIRCPCLNQACVALFKDNAWYRAEIVGLPGNRTVEVKFVDFGNYMKLPLSSVRQIKDEFVTFPAMAIQCSLGNVKPINSIDKWDEESTQMFYQLAADQLVSAIATGVVTKNRILLVELFVAVDADDNVDIGKYLVMENLAYFRSKIFESGKPLALGSEVWDLPVEGIGEVAEPDLLAEEQDGPKSSLLNLDLELPDHLNDLRARVCHVTSPGSFFVQLFQTDCQLARIHATLKEKYSHSDNVLVKWKENMHCAMLISGVWERGQICSIEPGNVAQVRRCDYGNKVSVPFTNLRPLKQELIGCLALECSLEGISPAGDSCTWSATACDFISYYLTGAMAFMTIKENTTKRPLPVTLYCSNKAGQDVSVADYLVGEGLALRERRYIPHKEKSPVSEQPKKISSAEDCVAAEAQCATQHRAPDVPRASLQTAKAWPYQPPDLPHCGFTQMIITSVGDDGAIYAMTKQAACVLKKLKESLQQHVRSQPQKLYSWKQGDGCVVVGSDMLCYRGEVLEVIGGHVKVRYVDQGLVEHIPDCHLVPAVLHRDLPRLCIPCQLHGVAPVGGYWQPDAVALLKELLLLRQVNVQIMERPAEPCGRMTVQIYLDALTLGAIVRHHQHALLCPSVTEAEGNLVNSTINETEDWDLNYEGLEEAGPVAGRYTYSVLPQEGDVFPAAVKHICTPDEMFLLPCGEAHRAPPDAGGDLDEALDCVNDSAHSLLPLSDFVSGGPCLAEYRDGMYYRAQLLQIESFNPVKILVRHVDYGSDDVLTTDCLREIPLQVLRFPCELLQVKVAGIKPPRNDGETQRLPYRPEWSLKSMYEAIDLLQGKQLTAYIVSTKPAIKAHLFDENEKMVLLPLVDKGLAEAE